MFGNYGRGGYLQKDDGGARTRNLKITVSSQFGKMMQVDIYEGVRGLWFIDHRKKRDKT